MVFIMWELWKEKNDLLFRNHMMECQHILLRALHHFQDFNSYVPLIAPQVSMEDDSLSVEWIPPCTRDS